MANFRRYDKNMIYITNKIKLIVRLGIVLSLTCTANALAANDDDKDSNQSINQQLIDVERQLELQKNELEQQKKQADKLEKSVDCNWKLLQAYNHCSVLFNEDVREQINCTNEAKKSYKQCMGGDEANSSD